MDDARAPSLALVVGRVHSIKAFLLRRSLWGIGDECVVSATNFVTSVLLARALGPHDFGTFVLAYAVLLFANGLQQALVTQPHNVLASGRTGSDYARFTTSLAGAQAVIAGGLGVTFAVVAVAAWLTGVGGTRLLIVLAPSVVAWQGQEFLRRVLYTEGRLAAAFVNDLVSYGGQTLAVVVLWRLDRLTGPTALVALSATSAAAVVVGLIQAWTSFSWPSDRSAWADTWRHGKWLAGAQIGALVSSQLYVYVAAALLGSIAAGVTKASQVLLGPLNVVLAFLDTVLPIQFRRAMTSSNSGMRLDSHLRSAFAFTAPFIVGYCVVVAALAGPLLLRVYGVDYQRYANVVTCYALFYVVSYAGRLVMGALRAVDHTRPIFIGNMVASAAALMAGVPCILAFGVTGVVVGMTISGIVLDVLVWRAYRRVRLEMV